MAYIPLHSSRGHYLLGIGSSIPSGHKKNEAWEIEEWKPQAPTQAPLLSVLYLAHR